MTEGKGRRRKVENSSCEPVLPLQGRNAGAALVRTVGTAHLSTPSTRLSPYPFLLPPPLFLSLSFFSPSLHPLPFFQPAPPQSPTHSMRRQGEEYDLTTLPEILPQQPPPPPTHTCTHKHTLLPSPLSYPYPCTPLPLSSSSPLSVPFPCSP